MDEPWIIYVVDSSRLGAPIRVYGERGKAHEFDGRDAALTRAEELRTLTLHELRGPKFFAIGSADGRAYEPVGHHRP